MTILLTEGGQIVPAFMPVDLNTAGAAGDWVNLSLYGRLTFVFMASVGTAGDDPTVEFLQATSNAGAGAKDLAVVDAYWVKEGATAISAVGEFTKKAQTADEDVGGSIAEPTSAENQLLWVVEIDAAQLDVNNGFTHLQANVKDDLAAAQLGCGLYILQDARFQQETAKSAIT